MLFWMVSMDIKLQSMAAWMTCNFTSFSKVFQFYQDDDRVIMKDCVQ